MVWPFSLFRRSRRPESPVGFDAFADHACTMAERVARRFGHEYISTEHMLLALLAAGPNPATTLLERCGVAPSRLRETVEVNIIRGPGLAPRRGRLSRAPQLNRTLEFARIEHEQQPGIAPEIALLIGLARNECGYASHALAAHRLTADMLRTSIESTEDGA